MARGVHGEVLLRPEARPIALDDARAEGRGPLASSVGGVRVDDHDLVAEVREVQGNQLCNILFVLDDQDAAPIHGYHLRVT